MARGRNSDELRKEKCSKCGKLLKKHIIKEGARYHVLSWSNKGTHCSETNCEINHHCKESENQ